MIDDRDADYYRRREQRERAQADAAATPEIARLHLQLADHYRAQLDAPVQPRISLVRPIRR